MAIIGKRKIRNNQKKKIPLKKNKKIVSSTTKSIIKKNSNKKKLAPIKTKTKKNSMKISGKKQTSVRKKRIKFINQVTTKTELKKEIKLNKNVNNPIIKPSFYSWESKATFNPAAFEKNGKVHIVYRAIGDDDNSVLGYAGSYDGINIEDRPTYCIYKRLGEYVKFGPKLEYSSGGSWNGGCEDPRLALIDGVVFMIYTAFDGWGSIRIALTSISLEDFKKKKWNWGKTFFLSSPGEVHKNWVIFPEKINGKFAILHSITPEILIDYVDSFNEFDGSKFIKSYYNSKPKWDHSWDNMVRGVGPTPIKTELGWLILYHSMDKNDPDRYKMGVMILDLKDPTKILYRSNNPILEPEEDYENNGHKWGVIYSCGAIVKNGILFVYYGGADKFTCVASIPLKELLDDLKENKEIKLKKGKLKKTP